MVVGNPPITAVANLILGEQVLLVQLELGAVGGGHFFIAPEARQPKAAVTIHNVPNRCVNPRGRDGPEIDRPDLMRCDPPPQGARPLRGAEIGAVAERSQDVALMRVVQLGSGAGQRAKMAAASWLQNGRAA
jgi:hypothetical protein